MPTAQMTIMTASATMPTMRISLTLPSIIFKSNFSVNQSDNNSTHILLSFMTMLIYHPCIYDIDMDFVCFGRIYCICI